MIDALYPIQNHTPPRETSKRDPQKHIHLSASPSPGRLRPATLTYAGFIYSANSCPPHHTSRTPPFWHIAPHLPVPDTRHHRRKAYYERWREKEGFSRRRKETRERVALRRSRIPILIRKISSPFTSLTISSDALSPVTEATNRTPFTTSTMEDQHQPDKTPHLDRSDSSSASSVDQDEHNHIHAPVPRRPGLPSRKSSGTIIVPRDSAAVGPVETSIDPDDVRAMSPRRSCEDVENLGKEARDELRRYIRSLSQCRVRRIILTAPTRHAKLLQDSLLTIFHRIEAVKEEHDKLDSNNRFLQKYIGDLMSTSKITATASSSRTKK